MGKYFYICFFCIALLLTGCSATNKYYEFHPIRNIEIEEGEVGVSIIGTWIDNNIYSKPYDIWVVFRSEVANKELSIINVSMKTKSGDTLHEIKNKKIFASAPETVLRDNKYYVGKVFFGNIDLQHERHTINLVLASPIQTKKINFTLKPLYREEKKSIRAILAN